MKPQHFAALAVAAAVSLVIALITYSASAPWTQRVAAGSKLFPGLESSLGKVQHIAVGQAGTTLTLEKSGERWQVKERDGFPASSEKVRALLVSLAAANLAEPKTRKEASYKVLELEDPKDKNANSYLVQLTDASGSALAEAVIGKSKPDAFGAGRAGSYVRKLDDPQTWLVDKEIVVGNKLASWARERLFEVTPESIKRATVTVAGEASLDIERESGGKSYKLVTKVPEGKKIRFANSVDDIVDTVSSFNLDEVRRPTTSGTPSGKAEIETDSGLKVTFEFKKDGDTPWVTMAATGDDKAKAAAEDLNVLGKGWEFKVPPSQRDRILKKMADLVEDKDEAPKPENDAKPPADASPPAPAPAPSP